MPDYQKSKIYKLYSPSKNLVYYGSTVQSISQRLAQHKNGNKIYNNDNTKKYCSSYLVVECEDYKIELLEEYPCNNKQQLCKKEGEYIKANECVNIEIAGRTKQEWSEDNPEVNKRATKKYCEEHKEQINERRREYCKNNIDKVKESKKKYVENNKEKIYEYHKQWRLKQKKTVN